jgi:hypothetical protein
VFHGVPRRRMSEQTHHGQPRFERISPILIIPRMAATEPNADISGKQKREATRASPVRAAGRNGFTALWALIRIRLTP